MQRELGKETRGHVGKDKFETPFAALKLQFCNPFDGLNKNFVHRNKLVVSVRIFVFFVAVHGTPHKPLGLLKVVGKLFFPEQLDQIDKPPRGLQLAGKVQHLDLSEHSMHPGIF